MRCESIKQYSLVMEIYVLMGLFLQIQTEVGGQLHDIRYNSWSFPYNSLGP